MIKRIAALGLLALLPASPVGACCFGRFFHRGFHQRPVLMTCHVTYQAPICARAPCCTPSYCPAPPVAPKPPMPAPPATEVHPTPPRNVPEGR
jgi:hypothetical protein